MLGLPAYGYVSRSTAETLRSRRRSSADPVVLSSQSNFTTLPANAAAPAANVTVISEAGSTASGQVQFNALMTQGALVRNAPGASPAFVGAGGFQREWDACSSTVGIIISSPESSY